MEEERKRICHNCGAELNENVMFCTNCGIKRRSEWAEAQPQIQTPPQQAYQPQPYRSSPMGQTGPQKEKHITYIFVVTLVMMILMALGSLGFLTKIKDFNEIIKTFKILQNGMSGAYYFFLIFGGINVLCLVWVFVFACRARNKNRSAADRADTAGLLFTFLIISLSVNLVFIVAGIVFGDKFSILADLADLAKMSGEKDKQIDDILLLDALNTGLIVYGVVYLGLGIAAAVKAGYFKRLMEEKIRQSPAPQNNNDYSNYSLDA